MPLSFASGCDSLGHKPCDNFSDFVFVNYGLAVHKMKPFVAAGSVNSVFGELAGGTEETDVCFCQFERTTELEVIIQTTPPPEADSLKVIITIDGVVRSNNFHPVEGATIPLPTAVEKTLTVEATLHVGFGQVENSQFLCEYARDP